MHRSIRGKDLHDIYVPFVGATDADWHAALEKADDVTDAHFADLPNGQFSYALIDTSAKPLEFCGSSVVKCRQSISAGVVRQL